MNNKFKTIQVSNFFDKPLEIIDYSKTLEFYKSDKSKDDQKWPGVRTKSLHSFNPNLFSFIINKVLSYYFKEGKLEGAKIAARVYFHKSNKKTSVGFNKTNSIHTDEKDILAGLIYLNKGNDIKTGTTLYDKNNKETVIFSNCFNTMICYNAKENHGPTSLNCNRLTVPFFIESIIKQ
jgi:hypothetical protein